MTRLRIVVVLLCAAGVTTTAAAQTDPQSSGSPSPESTVAVATAAATAPADPGAPAAPAVQAAAPQDDSDLDFRPLEPDFTLVALPTTLRVPRFKSAFRVTHRFLRPLGQGDFGSLLEDFFGLDSGAQIGLEYRFGLFRGAQVGIHRTSDRTIAFFSSYNFWTEGADHPIGLSAIASIDGTNNFRDSYTPALGAVVSRTVGSLGTIYAEPMWVNNSNPLPSELTDENDTFLLGLGARLRIRPTVYLVGEINPRVSGYDPGTHQGSIAIEKRAGGHVFQLNFSNGIGTTMGQIARGSVNSDDWFLGFNISRKFF
jgi:hypothetical protein